MYYLFWYADESWYKGHLWCHKKLSGYWDGHIIKLKGGRNIEIFPENNWKCGGLNIEMVF